MRTGLIDLIGDCVALGCVTHGKHSDRPNAPSPVVATSGNPLNRRRMRDRRRGFE